MPLISPSALRRLRCRAALSIEQMFPTVITVAGHEIPASRWKASSGADNELAGLLPTADLTLRVRLDAIPRDISFRAHKTHLVERGREYRVHQISDATGDEAIILSCNAS